MQISSASSAQIGHAHAQLYQSKLPAESTAGHAAEFANAGAPKPVEQAQASGATTDSNSSPASRDNLDRASAGSEKAKPEEAEAQVNEKQQDPLTDTSSEEYAQVKELQARDTEVRAHEQAHLNVAGQYATSGATFTFQTGPDGKQYAIGGEVGIDVSPIPDDPAATIAKMQIVQRAATAPAEPSGQDMRVAAQAAQTASAARAELASAQYEKMQGNEGADADAAPVDPSATPEPETPTVSATGKEAQQSYLAQQGDDEQPKFEASA